MGVCRGVYVFSAETVSSLVLSLSYLLGIAVSVRILLCLDGVCLCVFAQASVYTEGCC